MSVIKQVVNTSYVQLIHIRITHNQKRQAKCMIHLMGKILAIENTNNWILFVAGIRPRYVIKLKTIRLSVSPPTFDSSCQKCRSRTSSSGKLKTNVKM